MNCPMRNTFENPKTAVKCHLIIKVTQILNVCCALHNICTHFNVNVDEQYPAELEDPENDAESKN